MASCGCCSLKTGARIGAFWTMIESVAAIVLLLVSGLIGSGNILSIACASYLVVVFFAAWVLLTGVYREITAIIFAWVAVYLVWILIRMALLGFVVAAYIQMKAGEDVSYDFVFLSDGTTLTTATEMFDAKYAFLAGSMGVLAISLLFSIWVFVGVICLGAELRRMQRKQARMQSPYY